MRWAWMVAAGLLSAGCGEAISPAPLPWDGGTDAQVQRFDAGAGADADADVGRQPDRRSWESWVKTDAHVPADLAPLDMLPVDMELVDRGIDQLIAADMKPLLPDLMPDLLVVDAKPPTVDQEPPMQDLSVMAPDLPVLAPDQMMPDLMAPDLMPACAVGQGCDDGKNCTAGEKWAWTGPVGPGGACVCAGGVAYTCTVPLTAWCLQSMCDGKGGCLTTQKAGTCYIGGVCALNGAANPMNACVECQAGPAGTTGKWVVRWGYSGLGGGKYCSTVKPCVLGAELCVGVSGSGVGECRCACSTSADCSPLSSKMCTAPVPGMYPVTSTCK